MNDYFEFESRAGRWDTSQMLEYDALRAASAAAKYMVLHRRRGGDTDGAVFAVSSLEEASKILAHHIDHYDGTRVSPVRVEHGRGGSTEIIKSSDWLDGERIAAVEGDDSAVRFALIELE